MSVSASTVPVLSGSVRSETPYFQMITNGESRIKRVIAVNWDGKAMTPCGACRELMSQIMPKDYAGIEIMLDCDKPETVTFGELTPKWWI